MSNSHSIEQQQIDKLDSIRGVTGSHMDLAARVESIGLYVNMDSEDNERSEIILMGDWSESGGDVVVGEIIGDAEATIV